MRVGVEDGGDGSKRLFTAACRVVEYNLSDAQAIATVHEYGKQKPFPKDWTDDEILQRVRDAEKRVDRGVTVEIVNFEEIEVEGEDEVIFPNIAGDVEGVFDDDGGGIAATDPVGFPDEGRSSFGP